MSVFQKMRLDWKLDKTTNPVNIHISRIDANPPPSYFQTIGDIMFDIEHIAFEDMEDMEDMK